MANGMKKARYGVIQGTAQNGDFDQATHPQQVTFADSSSSSATSYFGGVGGTPTGTTSLVILVNYKTSAGTAKSDGFIVRQRGRKQFDVQSVAGGAATLTRCTLTGSNTLGNSEMYIKCVAPDGTLFYASRISNRYVWNGTTRYAYTLGNTDAVTYIDSTSGVTFTDSVGNTVTGGLAVVEGA